MKKLFLVAAIVVLGFTNVNAQEQGKVRGGLDLGYAMPSGGGGVLVNLDLQYNIKDDMRVGLRYGSAALAREITGNSETFEASISANSSFLATFDKSFNNGSSKFAPYLGAGVGMYSLASITIAEEDFNAAATSEFGGVVRVGIEIGKFRVGAEYNLVPKTKYEGGAEASNSYLGITLGFFVGGGKWGSSK